MTTKTDELKPCPFCGSADIHIAPDEVGSGGQWVGPVHVVCGGDCVAGQTGDDKEAAVAAWNTRAALQSQDREDAEWMACESRRPWVTNSLKHHIEELRNAEKRSRNAFKKDYMGEPARYFADACAEAAAVFEAKLSAIDHARRIEGEGE